MVVLLLGTIIWACYELAKRLNHRDKAAEPGKAAIDSGTDTSDTDGPSPWTTLDDYQLKRPLTRADPQRPGPGTEHLEMDKGSPAPKDQRNL